MKIRIGLSLGTLGLRDDSAFSTIVRDLERLSFDSLWLSERLTSGTLDPVTGLAFAAGQTHKLKLGTSVLVLPGRNPAILAKELASLDRLSEGRLLLAFGLGVADPVEHQAFGIEPRQRAPWFDEALPLLRRFWAGEQVHHEGPRFSYHGLAIRPTTIQQPIDVWLGGFAPAALRRVGRMADGWLPSQITPAEAAAGRAAIEEAAAAADRAIDPEHFGAIVVYARDEIPDSMVRSIASRRPGLDPRILVPIGLAAARERVEQFVEAGVSKFVVRPAEEPPDWTTELEELAEMLLPLQTRA